MTSLWSIFKVFFKIGAFTIGGGYAMIPIIKDELDRRHWIGENELPDILALAQSAPGILAVNVSIFTGYKIRGVKGSIAATLGSVLPSFLIILAIALMFSNFRDNAIVMRIFSGIRPVVVSLIAAPINLNGQERQQELVGMAHLHPLAHCRCLPQILPCLYRRRADCSRHRHNLVQ